MTWAGRNYGLVSRAIDRGTATESSMRSGPRDPRCGSRERCWSSGCCTAGRAEAAEVGGVSRARLPSESAMPAAFTRHRVAGGDRHHRRPHRAAAAGRPGGCARPPAARSAQTTSSNSDWRCTITTRPSTRSPRGAAPRRTVIGSTNLWGAWSAQAMMLPYLEQQAIYNSINFMWETQSNGYGTGISITAVSTKINAFICPSSPTITGQHRATSRTAGRRLLSAGQQLLHVHRLVHDVAVRLRGRHSAATPASPTASSASAARVTTSATSPTGRRTPSPPASSGPATSTTSSSPSRTSWATRTTRTGRPPAAT